MPYPLQIRVYLGYDRNSSGIANAALLLRRKITPLETARGEVITRISRQPGTDWPPVTVWCWHAGASLPVGTLRRAQPDGDPQNR